MQVTAINTPQDPSWRWRIVNYAGEVVAEAEQGCASMHDALEQGKEQLATMNSDQSQAVNPQNWRARHPPQG